MLLRLLVGIFFLTMTVFSQNPPLETGVSHALAKWRAANYSDVRYKLDITLEKGAPLMEGKLEIRVHLTGEGAKHDLILDWRATAFEKDKDTPYANVLAVNEAKNPPVVLINEHIKVPRAFLKAGENVIKIWFASPIKTSGAGVTRYVDKEDGAEYVYSLFVPSDASTAFPVFDQPDLKARFSLSATFPADWKVVTNTEASREYQVTVSDCSKNCELSKLDFYETKPISTYVFAFAAGNFEVFRECLYINKAEGKDVMNCLEIPKTFQEKRSYSKIYVRKSQAEKFKQHAAEIFRLNREGVKYLESYFDFKFPFPKYDIVLIPEFPFGGMEHAGATFLRESSVIFPSEPTANDYISRANVIFHEAAHQWFGDTVTMRWFDDLWLKEGFAEFMAYKTLEKVMPEYNAWKAFYERNKPLAYLTDSTRGTTPIYQEIPNLSAAKSAYGNIVYRKAPAFLRQAEFYLGEDKFQTAVRAFLKKHQYANAEWTDLVKEFETASKQDLKDWAATWVKERGLPIIKPIKEQDYTSIIGKTEVRNNYLVTQKSALQEKNFWEQRVKTLIIYDNDAKQIGELRIRKGSDSRNSSVGNINSIIEVKSNPKFIFPNYQDYGYGIFLLDDKSRDYVLQNIQNERDDFLRSMMWGTLWDSVREAELNPKDYVELAIKNISLEKDELTIQTILSRVSTAMNYYLSDAERAELAPRLEAVLLDQMSKAEKQGQRITFYRAYLNLASSAVAVRNLKDILKGKSKVAIFQLKTKDKYDIVTRLLILGDPDALTLLAGLAKTETGDDAKRYAYAALAGMGTAQNKERFFNNFVSDKAISESWIEAAFVPFNSVRHSDLTLPYLEKALAELPNLKRNRKIFFVNGWLGSFIGGQKSERALQVVSKFLADNPNLDRDLRLKILENVDGLERSVKIRKKFSGAR